jgi:hypothetical protein
MKRAVLLTGKSLPYPQGSAQPEKVRIIGVYIACIWC